MRTIQVPSSTLLVGETVAEDVITNKQLLVKKDTPLTDAIIESLKLSSVPEVTLYMRPERETTLLAPEKVNIRGLQFGKMCYLDVAEIFFGYVLRRQPKNIDANLYRGVTLFREKKYDLAKNRFKTTLILVKANEMAPQPNDTRGYPRLRKRLENYIEQCEALQFGESILRKLKKIFGLAYDMPVTYTDNDDLITRANLNDYDVSHLKEYTVED